MNPKLLLRCCYASLFLLCSLFSFAQQKTLTGKIIDQETGQPLQGVTVAVKGSAATVVSNATGEFSIVVPSNDAVLEISYVGYATQQVRPGAQSTITVSLVNANKQLGEVVVVGYGTQRRKDITGSVTSLRPEDFNKGVVLTPQALLQGRAAGVNVTPNSGRPGGAAAIRIRGGTSISANNEPLYVIDGVPLTLNNNRQTTIGQVSLPIFNQEGVNPLNSINPSDIASMEILKDASATAIYGSRGANGVVIITTKKGQKGRTSTTYDTYVGISKVAKKYDVLSADAYRQFMKDNNITNFTDKGANTNWQDQIYRTAFSQNHNLSISGGSENTTYRGSVGYTSQKGIIISSGIQNFTGRINLNHRAINNKLLIEMNLSGAQVEEDNAPISSDQGGEGGNMFKDAIRFNPTYPVYDATGNYSQINAFIVNPVSYAEQIEDFRTTRRNLGNVSATYNFIKPLSLNVNLGYSFEGQDGKAYVPRANPLGNSFGGLANLQESKEWSKILEITGKFERQLNDDNYINLIGGYSYQDFTNEGSRDRVSNFISDEFRYNNIGAGATRDAITSYKEKSQLISFYSRLNYNLMDRYLLTLTVRRDGSSKFGLNNKWGTFPSGSLAWRISNEGFFKKDGFVNDLKLRLSYGITGNQEIPNLASQATLGPSTTNYVIGTTPITAIVPERYANPDLKWEETAQANIGIDYQLLDNRIYGSLDFYKKNTTDLLLSFAIPSPSVVTTQLANVGEVENKGVEFTIGSRIIDRKDFGWKVDFNIAANRNKVLSLSSNVWSTKIIRNYTVSGFGFTAVNSQAIIPGEPLGTFYGPKFMGLKDGVQQFEDLDKSGAFSAASDVTIIGNSQPDFTFGLGNNFFYKNIDFSFFIRGVQGNDVFNNTALDAQRIQILPGQNVLAAALNEGIKYGQAAVYSSKWIEDGSFIRLDNLSLGYNFNITKIPVLKNARIYFTGQNLFLITRYTGLDPEVVSSVPGTGESPRGIDFFSYPRARTYMIGASVTF
ncbi:TonB-dependent receptor [Segetibacter sp. 3557_3]|uniref:SusC/RagA family TonB-linked outer membrane protein n=1 Tax=Segetibacter sp. 3557_3 TaxID=2547429 RepID=UPI0010586A64|nr:TonB-dependent receptor [Segetibacter sp. 3557_3]TDH24217.1 TonB-dependent receptor [Segetibacter sp. 3557_3]